MSWKCIRKRDTWLPVKRKVAWFGHVVEVKGTLANPILQGSQEGQIHEEGQMKTMVG